MSGGVQYTSSNGQRSEVIHDGPELRFDEDPFLEQVQRVLTKLNLTRRKIVRERSSKVRTPERSEETKMKDAVEIATSPEKIYGSAEWKRGTPARCTHYLTRWQWKRQLKPKPAFRSIDFWPSYTALTGASLIPSPTIATMLRSFNLFLKAAGHLDARGFGRVA